MKKDEIFLKRLQAEIISELKHISILMDEIIEQCKGAGGIIAGNKIYNAEILKKSFCFQCIIFNLFCAEYFLSYS